MKKNVTVHAVARTAGVSISTVSRVLNGTAAVSADKRAKVEAAMLKLGYRTQLIARHKSSSRLRSIGVMLQDLTAHHYGTAITAIEHALYETGYYPVFISGHWNPTTEQEALEILLDRQVAGLMVIGGHLSEQHLKALAGQVPTVILDRKIRGLEKQCLPLNNVLGGYLATRHLIQLGHRFIAHVTGDLQTQDARGRLQGYKQALEEASIPFNPSLVVEGDFTEQTGLMAAELLFFRNTPFTAVFCSNDQMAFGVRLALFRKGIRVPQDVSLVGFDDVRLADYLSPPLTTIKHPIDQMAHEAVKALIHVLDTGQMPSLPEFLPTVVIRESTRMIHHNSPQPHLQ